MAVVRAIGGREIGDSELDGGRAAFECFGLHFLGLGAVDVTDDDARTRGGKLMHDAAPDVGGTAGDDDAGVGQSEIHWCPFRKNARCLREHWTR